MNIGRYGSVFPERKVSMIRAVIFIFIVAAFFLFVFQNMQLLTDRVIAWCTDSHDVKFCKYYL